MSDERNITDRGLETCGKSEIDNTLNTHIDNEIKSDLNNNNINIHNKNINNKNNVKNYVNNKDKNTKSHKQKCEERQIKKKILHDKRQSIISEFNSLIYGEKSTHLTDTMKDLCMNHIRANVGQYDLVNEQTYENIININSEMLKQELEVIKNLEQELRVQESEKQHELEILKAREIINNENNNNNNENNEPIDEIVEEEMKDSDIQMNHVGIYMLF